MKTSFLAACTLAAITLTADYGRAQPWYYDFGTSTGSFSTASSGDSTMFVPQAELNGGKPRVRIGSTGGSFNLENQVVAFGSESYLRGVAPTSTSVNKFSMYNYAAGQAFTLRFRLRLGASDGSATVTSGTWSMFVGDGACYSDNSTFSGAQVFTGIRWQCGPSGAITTNYRNAGAWSTAGLSGTSFIQGQNFLVEIYGNNTTVELPYSLNGGQSVGANTFDLWIDGTLVGDNLPKGLLADASTIDSWMFYGESSPGNAANIFLDDIVYLNTIAESRLPVQLVYFNARAVDAASVTISWRTTAEVNTYGFEVQKSADGKSFATVQGSFVAGHGTTNTPSDYSFIDWNALPGVWFYRLRQLDLDGTAHLSDPVRIEILTSVAETTPESYVLNQNYPNPFNPVTTVGFRVSGCGLPNPKPGTQDPGSNTRNPEPATRNVKLSVYDLLGREVAVLADEKKTPGNYTVSFDGSGLPGGIYFYRMVATANGTVTFSEAKRMMLVK
jgi:hypothetical protein